VKGLVDLWGKGVLKNCTAVPFALGACKGKTASHPCFAILSLQKAYQKSLQEPLAMVN
jgi:hypothetical protein